MNQHESGSETGFNWIVGFSDSYVLPDPITKVPGYGSFVVR